MVSAVMPVIVTWPEVGIVPDQPREATHCVASVADQRTTVLAVPPMGTVAEYGDSENVSQGRGVLFGSTVTVSERAIVPPAPVQSRLNVEVWYSLCDISEPETA